MVQQQHSLIPPRFTQDRYGHILKEERGEKLSFPYFLHGMAVGSSQGENLADEGLWSCLPVSPATVLVHQGLCKRGIKELERKEVKGNQQIMERWERGVLPY